MEILEDKFREEKYPNLDMDGDVNILDGRDKHWQDMLEENIKDKEQVHESTWQVCKKETKQCIKREYLVQV